MTPPASKKRLALAIYLDLVVFSAAWGVVIHFVAPGRQHTLLQYGIFAALEAMLLAVVKWSPGEYFLSVFYGRRPYEPIEPEGTAPRGALVDPRVWSRETVLTVLLGVFLVVEGGKSFVRWTMWSPPQPFFGTQLSPQAGAVLAMAEGFLYVTVGALVLRLHPLAPAAVIGLNASQLANTIVSWRLWDEFASEMVLRRREYQGLPVREGEVELAQRLTPEGAIIIFLLEIAIVVAHRKRFRLEEDV
jgi:hypothetical protein